MTGSPISSSPRDHMSPTSTTLVLISTVLVVTPLPYIPTSTSTLSLTRVPLPMSRLRFFTQARKTLTLCAHTSYSLILRLLPKPMTILPNGHAVSPIMDSLFAICTNRHSPCSRSAVATKPLLPTPLNPTSSASAMSLVPKPLLVVNPVSLTSTL
jgi:hypothetical protein